MTEKDCQDLLEICKKFLREYSDACEEHHVGILLDELFAEVLRPMFEIVYKEEDR